MVFARGLDCFILADRAHVSSTPFLRLRMALEERGCFFDVLEMVEVEEGARLTKNSSGAPIVAVVARKVLTAEEVYRRWE